MVRPKDLKIGDRVPRFYRGARVWCAVTDVRKSRRSGTTLYYIRFERPAGISPNLMADHFYLSPQAKIEVNSNSG